jgi:phosphoglycolate phosphatase
MLRAVLFDFDFTLADSSPGILECTNAALRSLGLDAAAPDAVHRTIGLSLTESFRALTGQDDSALCSAYAKLFIQRADEVMAPMTTVYPQARVVLGALRARGLRSAIVSTKFRYRIEAILAAAGLGDAVDVIVGGDDVTQLKPHPAGLQIALARLEVPGNTALYVGDHPVDAAAARGAGVRFVRVMTGADHGVAPWSTVEAVATLENVGGLVALLEELSAG